jgi:hypothetical protein
MVRREPGDDGVGLLGLGRLAARETGSTYQEARGLGGRVDGE